MTKQLDLTQGSIFKHLLHIAVPASTGALFLTFYNLTDTYFASKLSTEGLSALSLSFPVYLLLAAFISGFNSAGVASIGNAMGAKDENKKNKVFTHLIYITLALTAIFYILAPLYLRPLFSSLNAKGQTLDYAVSYMSIIIIGFPINMFATTLNGLLNAAGNTKSFRNIQIVSAVLNVALDPLFMFGLGDWFPAMGIAGIALATVISQAVTMLYLLKVVIKGKLLAGLLKTHWKPQIKLAGELLNQSYPQIFNMMMISSGIFVINYYLSVLNQDSAVAAYGVGVRIEQIALLPAMGLNVAILSMVSQNMGAKNFDRISKIYTTALKLGAVVMVVMLLVILPFSTFWISIFNATPLVSQLAFQYLIVVGFTYYGYILIFSSTSFLQAIKRPYSITWIALTRQVILPWLIFPLVIKYTNSSELGIFISIGSINWLAALVLNFIVYKEMKKLK